MGAINFTMGTTAGNREDERGLDRVGNMRRSQRLLPPLFPLWSLGISRAPLPFQR